MTERAPSLASVAPEVHPAIAALVDKVLSYERELRFQTAREFRAALQLADVAIAGDEASPSLRVPSQRTPSLVQADSLALTTEGVAASVRGGYTHASFGLTSHAKALIAVSGLAAGALVVLLGRGLFGATGKPTAIAASSQGTPAAQVAPLPTVVPDYSAALPAVPIAPVTSGASIAPIAPSAAPTSSVEVEPGPALVRPAQKPISLAARSAPNGAAPITAHAPKTAAELLKKRH